VARYIHGPGIDAPLAAYRGSTSEFYEADGLGSITSLTNTSGVVNQTYLYDSFGNTSSTTGTFVQAFRYTGREFDAETGLLYYRARYYDSATGRFLSEDPDRFAAGINFYPYVLNNPVRFRDPSGRNPGVLALPWLVPAGEGVLGVICFGSGACETVIVVGGVVVGVAAISYLAYDYFHKPKAIPKPSPRGPKCNSDKHCEEIYAADLAVCWAIPDKQQQAVCARAAATRYGECLAYGEPRSPLSWWR